MLRAKRCIRWTEGTSVRRVRWWIHGSSPRMTKEERLEDVEKRCRLPGRLIGAAAYLPSVILTRDPRIHDHRQWNGGTNVSDIFTWQIGALPTLAALAFGYLLGSIPFGLLLTRMAGLGDVRKIGSGNIGATNVLRTGNKKLAAATLLLDALKGTAATAIASRYGLDAGIAAGFAAFLGHLFPIWLGFKGGKGVATYVGLLLGLVPVMVPVFAVIWIGLAYLTRYSSLSALVATAASPVVLWLLGQEKVALLFLVLTLITWWKHSANIGRLMKGTESKIGSKG